VNGTRTWWSQQVRVAVLLLGTGWLVAFFEGGALVGSSHDLDDLSGSCRMPQWMRPAFLEGEELVLCSRPVAPRSLIATMLSMVLAAGLLLVPGPAGAVAGAKAGLKANEALTGAAELFAPGGLSWLQIRPNGNLVLAGRQGKIWQSNTKGSGATSLTMQPDGNLVLSTAGGTPVWWTATGGNPGSRFSLTATGLLRITTPGSIVLWSNTSGGTGASMSSLGIEQSIGVDQAIVSEDGSTRLTLQASGDLVVTTTDGSVIWSSGTGGSGGARLVMQTDGNAVLYTSEGAVAWQSATAGHPGSRLTIAGGTLQVLDGDGAVLWPPPPPPVTTLASAIVTLAKSQDQNKAKVSETPMGSNCNPYTSELRGDPGLIGTCPIVNGVQYRHEAWCSDFAQWVWLHAGADTKGITAWSFTFVNYGRNHGTFKKGALNNPQPGDAVVFGDYGRSYGSHVGIITGVRGDLLQMVSGNWGGAVGRTKWEDAAALAQEAQYPIIGYITPAAAGASQPRGPLVASPRITQRQIDSQDQGN